MKCRQSCKKKKKKKKKKKIAEYKLPRDTKTFQTVKEAFGNPMFPIIQELSRSLAMELQSFLSIFQADRPLSVFLCEKLKDTLYGLYQRIVKPKVLEANTTVVKMMSLDLSKGENLLSPALVNVGFGAQSLIKKLPTVNQKEVHEFRKATHNVIKESVEKLCERSPLKYKLTRAISSFSLIFIGTLVSQIMGKIFGTLLEILSESGWVSTVAAEKATKEYKILLHNKYFLEKAKEIDVKFSKSK